MNWPPKNQQQQQQLKEEIFALGWRLNWLNMTCRTPAILKPDTDLYESYLAPRVAAVQSERRPTAVAAAQAAAAAAAAQAANEAGLTNGRAKDITGLYGMYDSPTMLPRTPLAPGK